LPVKTGVVGRLAQRLGRAQEGHQLRRGAGHGRPRIGRGQLQANLQ
jgi:hypothetical protein